ncbi:sulfite exporter TauE/SafE family protein [Colwellia ponticola]|uniref:Sulfite exporter TauE/SafE family protein n=1 Tax=Colwellia ponticola TaxID=2304625 RepID=A0A8H2JM65_9GAMM|nr:sulfite exporter TauE/SafE family protein [Colwellia ponticola]TMM46422.1 sulfite exporter TauE/SafE family protein [Colwellia ponticola]
MTLDLFSAFLIGLLGSGHCLAMCGGITTMLTSAVDNQPLSTNTYRKANTKGSIPITVLPTSVGCSPQTFRLNLIFFYHVGRIASYCLIGAIVGFTSSIAAKNIGLPLIGLRLVAAVFLILLGLYIGQWLLWLNRVESLGKGLWHYLSPMAKYVIPVNNRKKALALGALWGWLPCGLVYSTLTWALASGNIITGAAIMLFFGLGTLPALVGLSLGINSIKKILTNRYFRKVMAISLIVYGIYSFIVAYQQLF